MLHEIQCRCGENKKRFKLNIGDFYIDECCTKKGFDHLGNPPALAEGETVTEADGAGLDEVVTQTTEITEQSTTTPTEPQAKTKPSSASALKKLIGMIPGRGKLRDKNRDELIKIAQEKGLTVQEGATKNELIAAILS